MSDDADHGPQIASVGELMEVLSPITGDGRELWYRGHRDWTWGLEASALRPENRHLNERAMLARFRQEAAATGRQFPFDNWGWITFAQHHGLPTRLLDWSQSPLVALYFACEPDPAAKDTGVEPDGEFFILNPNDLNSEAGDSDDGHPRLLSDTDEKLTKYLPGKDADDPSKPRSVVAPMIFDRIRFQSGTFTVAQIPPVTADQQPLRKAKALQSFPVPGDTKSALREQLDALGFNEASIYRDLDRIAKRIKTGHGRGRA
ncbi:FRG domain-containing protein [Dietzia alimentaria]|uniref:FRG domain-containing protein n=1 Tax=Dietzia alimentaria TaxID=665550 RepID=UPI000299D44B|nr:FRG domain-containing protein [Dietzia alimentaria]